MDKTEIYIKDLSRYIFPKELVQIVIDYLCIRQLLESEIKDFFELCPDSGYKKFERKYKDGYYFDYHLNYQKKYEYIQGYDVTLLFVNADNFIIKFKGNGVFPHNGGFYIKLLNYKNIKSYSHPVDQRNYKFDDNQNKNQNQSSLWDNYFKDTKFSFNNVLNLIEVILNQKVTCYNKILCILSGNGKSIKLALKLFFKKYHNKKKKKRSLQKTNNLVCKILDSKSRCFDIVVITKINTHNDTLNIDFFNKNELTCLYNELASIKDNNGIALASICIEQLYVKNKLLI